MKKGLSYLGWMLFVVTLITMFWITKPSKTVDFYGIVREIEYDKDKKCTYFTTSMLYDDNSRVIIKAKAKITVKEVSGEKMNVSEIQVGDMIGLDYRGTIDGDGSIVTAKWIKVAKDYTLNKCEVD